MIRPFIICLVFLILGGIGLVYAEDDGGETAIPGLANFEIAGVGIVNNALQVRVNYDATRAGNPWQGGIHGYGEIDELVKWSISTLIYVNDTRAQIFVASADELYPHGYAGSEPMTWIEKHSKNIYGTTSRPDGQGGDQEWARFAQGDPLSGTLEANLSLKKLAIGETFTVIVWASIEYKGFSKYMLNFDIHGPLSLEYVPDLDIWITGPSVIMGEDREALFNMTAAGSDVPEIDRVDYAFEYHDGDGWVELKTAYSYSTSQLKVEGELLRSFQQLARDRGGMVKMRVTAEALRSSWGGMETMVRSNTHAFLVQTMKAISGRITAWGIPVRRAMVDLSHGGGEIGKNATDMEGLYSIQVPEQITVDDKLRLTIHLMYFDGGKVYFQIHHFTFDPPAQFYEEVNLSGPHDVDLPQLAKKFAAHAHGYVGMYLHFSEALEYYRDHLGVNMDYHLPLKVYTFMPEGSGIKYNWAGDERFITIEEKYSIHETDHRPEMREYHEFSHYAMDALYGGVYTDPSPPKDGVLEINHGGYINPSTRDSFHEGFAIFMSAVIAEYYANYWRLESPPDQCSNHGSMETNWKPWQEEGKAEELAIATLLWDLYDGEAENEETTRKIKVLLRMILDFYLNKYDSNSDGKLSIEEIREGDVKEKAGARAYRAVYEFGSYTGYLDEAGLFVSLVFEDPDPILDGIPVQGLRANSNFTLMATQNGIDIDAVLAEADADGDGNVDSDELMASLRTRQLPRMQEIVRDYDGDGDGKLKESELREYLLTIIEPMEGINEVTNVEDLVNQITGDDEKVDLDFGKLWDVLKMPHWNFKSVYEALLATFPGEVSGIREIFIKHGIFADVNPGNGKYDEGEPFRDAGSGNKQYDQGEYFVDLPPRGITYDEGESVGNATNYARPWRSSTVGLPGHYIKVDNQVPFYDIEVVYRDHPLFNYAFPTRIYHYTICNDDGMVYVPVPPEDYKATITITGHDVTTGNPLIFTSEDFSEAYRDSVLQGYYVEHDFQVSGEIPPLPPLPISEGVALASAVLLMIVSWRFRGLQSRHYG